MKWVALLLASLFLAGCADIYYNRGCNFPANLTPACANHKD